MNAAALITALALYQPIAIQEAPPQASDTEAAIAASVEAARVALPELNHRIEHQPQALDLRIETLGLLYVLGVEDRSYLDQGDAEIERVRDLQPTDDLATAAILTAYAGAYEVVRAKHANWPFHKLGHVKDGLKQLDAAVMARPEDPRIRFLRLTSCVPLPFFIGRGESVTDDTQALATILVAGDHSLSEESAQEMATFLLHQTELEGDMRVSVASVAAPTYPGGG